MGGELRSSLAAQSSYVSNGASFGDPGRDARGSQNLDIA